jgi:hypothetical protein
MELIEQEAPVISVSDPHSICVLDLYLDPHSESTSGSWSQMLEKLVQNAKTCYG